MLCFFWQQWGPVLRTRCLLLSLVCPLAWAAAAPRVHPVNWTSWLPQVSYPLSLLFPWFIAQGSSLILLRTKAHKAGCSTTWSSAASPKDPHKDKVRHHISPPKVDVLLLCYPCYPVLLGLHQKANCAGTGFGFLPFSSLGYAEKSLVSDKGTMRKEWMGQRLPRPKEVVGLTVL